MCNLSLHIYREKSLIDNISFLLTDIEIFSVYINAVILTTITCSSTEKGAICDGR